MKSHWKTNLKRWVLSPARNWLRLMDGERRWSGSEFQTTGAVMKKLHLYLLYILLCCLQINEMKWNEMKWNVPNLVFLFVERTDRHARPSGHQDGLNCQRLCNCRAKKVIPCEKSNISRIVENFLPNAQHLQIRIRSTYSANFIKITNMVQ